MRQAPGMARLLLLFLVLPVVELALLLRVGARIGIGPTLVLIVLTGVLGASLARSQGLAVLGRLQGELQAGRMPTQPILDGVAILIAAALLVTPGILTDAVGFALLTPAFREGLKRHLVARFERAVREGRVRVVHAEGNAAPREEKVVYALDDEDARRPR
ncbi:MAG: FxsA family protein [Myxococcota bacterium]